MSFQSRYVAYARACGRTPVQQSAHDRGMTEFQVWVRQRWREWRHLTGAEPPHSAAEHAVFDAWLDARVLKTRSNP